MDHKLKEEILWVFNNPEMWISIEAYINYRINKLRELNDNASGDTLLKQQGAIAELKELKRAREALRAEHAKATK